MNTEVDTEIKTGRHTGQPNPLTQHTLKTLSFRSMHPEDIPNVLHIEQQAHSHPWTHGIFTDCLHSKYHCYVAENNRVIMGYGILSTCADEAHILNICIAPNVQRKGLGQKMLKHLLKQAIQQQVSTVFLEVRASNHAAIGLYDAHGFCEIATRKNYYPTNKGRESALILAKELNIKF